MHARIRRWRIVKSNEIRQQRQQRIGFSTRRKCNHEPGTEIILDDCGRGQNRIGSSEAVPFRLRWTVRVERESEGDTGAGSQRRQCRQFGLESRESIDPRCRKPHRYTKAGDLVACGCPEEGASRKQRGTRTHERERITVDGYRCGSQLGCIGGQLLGQSRQLGISKKHEARC